MNIVIIFKFEGGENYGINTEQLRAQFAKELTGYRREGKGRPTLEEIIGCGVDQVCFDFDSTLNECEGIDLMADLKMIGGQVRQLTNQAMGAATPGQIFFERLDLIQPTRQDLQQVAQMCASFFVTNAKEVIAGLKYCGIDVFIISGGYREILWELAPYIGVARKQIFTNMINFDPAGNYISLDPSVPLWDKTGKPLTIRRHISPEKKVMMVGDGGTDLATYPDEAAIFIGCGGVTHEGREQVETAAPIYLYHKDLAPVFVVALGESRWAQAMRGPHKQLLIGGMNKIVARSVDWQGNLEYPVVLRGGYGPLRERVINFLETQAW